MFQTSMGVKRGKKVAEKTLAVNGATVAVWMDTNDEEEKEEEEELSLIHI